jgi:cysteine desulfurase
MNKELIYLDHAAATPVSESVMRAMAPYFSEKFFNPSSAYIKGVEVRRDYEAAKDEIARTIGAKSDELVMTAGATESINLAFSAINNFDDGEILVGKFEHHSVLAAAERSGSVQKINITKKGMIDLEDLRSKISPQTVLVSVMIANNETGAIQPLASVAEIIRAERLRRLENDETRPIYLHSDASQGVGQVDVHVSRLGVDMLTINAGKIYGPKQTGLLWVSKDVRLQAQIVGGGQERNLRSGTENVPSVIGFARAMKLAEKHRKSENERLKNLKTDFIKILKSNFSETELVSVADSKKQLNSHIAISFPGVDAERIIFMLETQNVMVSTGSACAANKHTRSQTLAAMGLGDEVINGSLRISLGKLSTAENTRRAAEIISQTIRDEINRLRGSH